MMTSDLAGLETSIAAATDALLAQQRPDGHWVFELEADATIPAEYVLLTHYLGETPDLALEQKIGAYLRRTQGAHGGWPLFHDGDLDVSATVKAYFALKMIGDPVDAAHMRRAREALRARGGAERANVFTRIMLALFGFIPWRAAPVMPVEIMLLPKWFPFHLDKVSYWSRTVIVPLLVLMATKPRARNSRGVTIDELFVEPPQTLRLAPKAPQQKALWFWLFRGVDNALRLVDPLLRLLPTRRRATGRAVAWVGERLNGEDGLGAIFPAMANSVMMFDALDYAPEHPQRAIARTSIEKLLAVHDHEAYCQPCISPVWDTGLACHALLEAGGEHAVAQARKGLDWLGPKQILDVRGDWIARRPDLAPGGWAFQYANPHYPDVDDTAVVAMAMDRVQRLTGHGDFQASLDPARTWVVGMQSRNGAWGAFDADNECHYLNNIPFADHGALLDPPTEDVTARCVSMLAQLGEASDRALIVKALDYLRRTQHAEGSWFGRWGMNYIYGAWSVLCALNAAGVDHGAPEVRKAVDWLLRIQNADGGWGEDGISYKLDYRGHEPAPSTASQTAWGLLGLMAAGEVAHSAVAGGVEYLLRTQAADGLWNEPRYTATGFPRVFYLRYHGYAKFFPLWALARYRNLRQSNERKVDYGM